MHERKVSNMKPRILPRSRWTNTKSGAVAAKADQLVGVTLHHPGSGGTIGVETEGQTAARLEGYRRHHVNVNGWKDIAYNVAVDQAGSLWTLRGVSRQSGANGTTAANRSRGAILMLIGNSETPSQAMIDGVLYAARLWDVRYSGIRWMNPHSYFVSTSCPGPKVRTLLNDGETFYMATARKRWPDVKP